MPKKSDKPLPPKALQPLGGRGRGNDTTVLRTYDPASSSTIVPGAPPQPKYVITDVGGNVGAPNTSANDLFDVGGTGGGDVSGGGMPGGYSPATYNRAFWSNPDALAQDILAGQGIDNAQFTNTLAPTVDAVQLLTSFLGSDQPGEMLGVSGQAGNVDALINQLLTPGGQALDPASIMNALANADPNSLAGQYMNSASPDEIANLATTLMSAAGGNPFQAKAMEAMFAQGGRDYNIDLGKGGQGVAARPYWQGLASGEFGKYFGG